MSMRNILRRLWKSWISAPAGDQCIKSRTQLKLEPLEDRVVLTAYVFVEFGDNFPVNGTNRVLTTTVGAVRDVAAAQYRDPLNVFPIPNTVIPGPQLIDANKNNYAGNTVVNLTQFTFTAGQRAQMMANARGAFASLDVTLVELTATAQTLADGRTVAGAANMIDVIATLRGNDTTTKDVYVIVAMPGIGTGNANPRTFATNAYGGIAPTGTVLGETTDLQSSFNDHDDVVLNFRNDANTLVHEAGHALGLRHGVTTAAPAGSAINNLIPTSEAMSYLSSSNEASLFFSRYPMVRGDSNTQNNNDLEARQGQQTPFDQLRVDINVGENPNLQYISGTGANDIITITRGAGNTANVTVQAFAETTYTTAINVPGTNKTTYTYTVNLDRRLLIQGGLGDDRIVIDGDLGTTVTISGMQGTDHLVVYGGGAALGIYTSGTNTPNDLNGNSDLRGQVSYGNTNVIFQEFEPTSTVSLSNLGTVRVQEVANRVALTVTATNVYVQRTAANATVNTINCVNVNVGGGNVSDIQSAVHVRPATGLIKKVATNLTVDFALDSTAQNIDIFDNVVVFQGKSIVDFLQNGLLTLTVNGGPGNGTGGNLFFVFSTPGVNALTLNTGTGKDIVQVIACSSPVTIRGQNGADTVQIGSDARGLEAVRATVNVNNQNGFTDLVINDKAGTQNHPNIVMHPGQILGIGSAINFAASDIRFLTVNTGSGVNTVKLFNTIRVRPLSAGGTTINTSGGPTNIYVSATTGPLNINLGGFSETVTLGAVGSSAGSLNSIQGAVFVHGSGRLNFLRIDDQANTVDRQYIVKGNSLSTTGVADISFDGIYDFTLAAGRGGDTIDVWDNPTVNNAFSGVALLAGGGNDTINLGALTHQLSSLRRLFVDGQGGVNTLVLHDEATAEAQTYQYVTPVNPLVGYPSVSSTGIVVPYANLSRVNLYGGIGNDTVNVLGVPANVTANVDAGFGNDQVNVGADTLDKILGSVYVSDRQGIDFLDINDQGRAAPQTYTLTSVRRTLNYESRLRLGDGRSVAYFGINGITLNAGRGGNTIKIEGTPPDTQVLVNSGTGADTLSVGDGKNRLDSILGQVNIEGQGGVDHLRFNDQGTTNGRNYSITANGLSRTDAALVLHSGMADVVINGSAGDDNFGEALTDADMPLTINGGGGSDFLASNAIPTTWRVTADNAGKINNNITFKSVENLYGSDEDDTFVFSKGASLAGSVTGACGVNTLDYSAFTTHVTVNLVLHAATGVGAGVYQIQNAVGGSGNDILVGDGGNVLKGGAGRDLLIAGALASTLDGGAENDLLLGGTTDYDHDDAALLAILAEWATNRTASLLNATTVYSNGGSNRLTGGDGLDLFFAKFQDELLDWDPLQETWVMLL